MTARRWRALLIVLMVSALLFAVRPLTSRYEPETLFPGSDKLVHVGFFALLWFVGRGAGFAAGWRLAMALFGYGTGIEVAQALAPTMRSASLQDVAADSAGILLAWVLGQALARRTAGQPQEDRR